MPLYEYSCKNCDNVFASFAHVSECMASVSCPVCKGNSERIYSQIKVKSFQSYYDNDFGKEITSERQKNSELKKHKMVDFSKTKGYENPSFKEGVKKAKELAKNKVSVIV